jgi:recombination protein RecA
MRLLNEVMRSSITKYGLNTISRGDTAPMDFPRIPTGIFPLDYAIGGGFPMKVTSSLYGPPGGGKSSVMQKLISTCQKFCFGCWEYEWDCECEKGVDRKEAVVVCTEIMDLEWAKVLGVNTDLLAIAEPDYGEQAGDIIIELLKTPDVGAVFLDSIAMLTPLAELEGSMEDFQVAGQARLIAKLIRKIKSTLIREKKKNHHVMFVATNQVRTKIGLMFGNPEEVPGGFCSKHDWHLSLRMSQLTSKDKDSETDMTVNGKFKASIAAMANKKKIFTMSGSAEYFMTLADGGEFHKGTVVDFKTFEKFANQIGFIERSPWKILDREYKTKAEMVQDWVDDPQWYLSIKKKCIDELRGMQKMEMGV